MIIRKICIIFVLLICLVAIIRSDDDDDSNQPCAAREVEKGRSVVCVCNSTYCDSFKREAPSVGTYVMYTTSKSGKRFEMANGTLETYTNINADMLSKQCGVNTLDDDNDDDENDNDGSGSGQDTDGSGEDSEDSDQSCSETFWRSVSFSLELDNRQQYLEGFGGTITDSVAYVWHKLSEETRSKLISTYFGENGLGYNMIRIPIGGSDFSSRPYTYNDYPLYDETLYNFTLAEEDTEFKIPMIKAIQEVSKEEIKLIASTWSPPVWMKSNQEFYGYSQLQIQYYQSYADYHIRFLEEYEKHDVTIWAITTTNKPSNGIIPDQKINSLGWLPADLGRWIAINLGPTLRRSRFNKTLIFAVDDELHLLDWYLNGIQKADKTSMQYIDGIAVQYHSSSSSPSLLLDSIKKKYNKVVIGTQASEGATGWDSTRVKVGSWARASRYIQSIMEDLNHHSVGWMDYNLCLDKDGGPNWAGNYVDSAILVDIEKDEFIKQPMFYAMGHFTKFIPKGSQRVTVSTKSIVEISNVAFITPDGNILVILHNTKKKSVNVHIRINVKSYLEVTVEAQSIKTIEINPSESILCKEKC